MWGSMLDKMQQLLEFKSSGNVEEVREYLEDRWSTVREVATMVLSEIGSPEDFYLVLEKLEDESPAVRLAAAYGLENLATADTLSILIQLVKEKREPAVKNGLTEVIGRLKKKKKKK